MGRYIEQVVLSRRITSGLLFILLVAQSLSAAALSGPEVLAVADSGTPMQFQAMLHGQTLDELYRVRRRGKGLMHLALDRGEVYWRMVLAVGWPLQKEQGWTPQHEAALMGLDKAMAALITGGASVDVREGVNGGTPLHVAAFNGRMAVVKVLVEAGAKVNPRDNDGWTPLSQARDQGFPEIVEWLKLHGATR